MRKLVALCKVAQFLLIASCAVGISYYFAIREQVEVAAAPKSDMEITSVMSMTEETPVSGLSDSIGMLLAEKIEIVVPIQKPIKKPKRTSQLSDGKFEELSAAWKLGVRQVVSDKRCNRVSKAFMVGETLNPLLRQAKGIVESNCDSDAIGDAGEIGLFQPMPETCKGLGITGDLRDPVVNAACTEAHNLAACREAGDACTDVFLLLAHNRGPRGALRVKKPLSTTYMRRIDYARKVLQGI